MKLINRYSILLAVISVIIFGSCGPDDPNPCPDVEIGVEIDSTDLSVTITAEGLEDLSYQWYVNDVLVDSVNLDDVTDHVFDFEFEPGMYNVCIVAQSEQCDASLEFCKEVEIPDPNREECLGLNFTTDEIGDHAFKFRADFEGIENVAYTWWVNEDSIKTEQLDGDRLHFLEWEFEAGEHIVCIVAESAECGEVEYCKEIVVEQVCPTELFFEAEEDGHNTYFFFADFPNRDHIPYVWYIGDEIVDKENFDSHETDHKLFWQFDPGTHTICIVSEIEGCEEVEYCIELVLEVECVEEVFFNKEKESDNLYKFYSDFEGQEHTPYKWLIDDEIVDMENFDGTETDHKLIWDFEPGEYSVCIVTDQDDCEVVEYCETIVVEESVCKDISFTGAQDAGTDTFTFTADFEGKDDVTYIWIIYVDDVKQGEEVRQAGSTDDHKFSWQFDEGVVYEVCLKQDGDCEEAQVCKEFSLPG